MEDNLFNWLTNNSTEETEKGGQGSGNFGHAGRPGHQGGSAGGKGGTNAGVKKPTAANNKNALLKLPIKKLRSLQTTIGNKKHELFKKVPESEKLTGANKSPDTLAYEEADDAYNNVTWAITNHPSWKKKEINEITEKGGQGSGNFGHTGRPGKVGGSAGKGGAGASAGENSAVSTQHAQHAHGGSYGHMGGNAPDPARHIHHTLIHHPEGFTYQPVLNSSPKKGMVVSIFPGREENFTPPPPITVDEIRSYIKKNADLLIDPRNNVGGWKNTKTGETSLDISIVVSSRSKAAELCRQYKQFAFWDLAAGEEVRVEGAREEAKERTKGKGKNWVRFQLPADPSDADLEEFVKFLNGGTEDKGKTETGSKNDREGNKS